jgi:Zn-finger protein
VEIQFCPLCGTTTLEHYNDVHKAVKGCLKCQVIFRVDIVGEVHEVLEVIDVDSQRSTG